VHRTTPFTYRQLSCAPRSQISTSPSRFHDIALHPLVALEELGDELILLAPRTFKTLDLDRRGEKVAQAVTSLISPRLPGWDAFPAADL